MMKSWWASEQNFSQGWRELIPKSLDSDYLQRTRNERREEESGREIDQFINSIKSLILSARFPHSPPSLKSFLRSLKPPLGWVSLKGQRKLFTWYINRRRRERSGENRECISGYPQSQSNEKYKREGWYFFEVLSSGVKFMNDILETNDVGTAKDILNHRVVGDGDSLSFNFT